MIDKRIAVAVLGVVAVGGAALIYSVTRLDETLAPEQRIAQPVMQAGTQCLAPEKVVFNCELSKKIASVCKAPAHLILRYGSAGEPDVVLASNGTDGNALTSGVYQKPHVEEAGVTEQEHLRFKQGEVSYMVFSSEYTPAQGKEEKDAGLAIFHSKIDLVLGIATTEKCLRSTTSMSELRKATLNVFPQEIEGTGATGAF